MMQKCSRLADKVHSAAEGVINIVSNDGSSTLKKFQSLITDFQKTSVEVRELVVVNKPRTTNLIDDLDRTITGFNEVIQKLDETASNLSKQNKEINIPKIKRDLKKISGKALGLIESFADLASTIEKEIPDLSHKINGLLNIAFEAFNIFIDNLDRLEDVLTNVGGIAQNLGDKGAKLLNDAMLFTQNTDRELKRMVDSSTKVTNNLSLITVENKGYVKEIMSNLTSISRMLCIGTFVVVYRYLSNEDNLKSPSVFSTIVFFVFSFFVFGMKSILKSSSLLAPRGWSPLFQDLHSLHQAASVEETKESTSNYDKPGRLSLEDNRQKIKARFKEFITRPLAKKSQMSNEEFEQLNVIDAIKHCYLKVPRLCDAAIEQAKGKDLTIVIGKRRAGGELYTFMPKIITIQVGNRILNLCELPNFDDYLSTSIEEKIVAANVVHMVSQVCRSIQAIVIVIPLGNLTSDGWASLRHVAATFSTIFKSNSNDKLNILDNSFSFIIQADPSEITVEKIMSDYVDTILIPECGQGLIDKRHHLNDEESKILDLLCSIHEGQGRILISNTCDNWESDQNTLNRLVAYEIHENNNFCFTNFDPNQDKFRSIVLPNLVSLYSQKMNKNKQDISKDVAILEEKYRYCHKLVAEILKNQNFLEQKRLEFSDIPACTEIDTSTLENLEKAQEDLEAMINTEQDRIAKCGRNLAEERKKFQSLSKKISEIDTDELVVVWSDRYDNVPLVISHSPITSWGKVKGKNIAEYGKEEYVPVLTPGSHTFEFNAGYSLCHWEVTERQKGNFQNDQAVGHRYPISRDFFVTDFNFFEGKEAKAAVRVFAYSRDKNQKLISELNVQLKHIKARITEIENEVESCRFNINEFKEHQDANMRSLEKLGDDQIENNKNELRRKDLESDIEKIENRISGDKKMLANKRKRRAQWRAGLDKLELELTANHELFDTVMKISNLLELSVDVQSDRPHKDDLSDRPHKTESGNTSQNRHSFHSPKSPVIDRSWYTCDKIHLLLKKQFENASNASKVNVLYSMLGTSWKGKANTVLVQSIFDHTLNREPNQDLTIIPVNLNDSHWVLVCINFTEAESPVVFYFDPLGHQPNSEVIAALKIALPDMIFIPQDDPPPQKDGYNCGPWIIEIAICFTEGRLKDVNKVNISVAREKHDKLLQKNEINNELLNSHR